MMLPTESADSSGPWLPLESLGAVAAGSADSSGPRALGGVICRLFVVSFFAAAVAGSSLLSSVSSVRGRRQ